MRVHITLLPVVNVSSCKSSGECFDVCPFDAIKKMIDGKAIINPEECIPCGACEAVCPTKAITDSDWVFQSGASKSEPITTN